MVLKRGTRPARNLRGSGMMSASGHAPESQFLGLIQGSFGRDAKRQIALSSVRYSCAGPIASGHINAQVRGVRWTIGKCPNSSHVEAILVGGGCRLPQPAQFLISESTGNYIARAPPPGPGQRAPGLFARYLYPAPGWRLI